MKEPWAAEHEVSAGLAQALIEEQFPSLAPADVILLGAGWDNTAFTVNGDYIYRFPRRTSALNLLLAESKVLPELAKRAPLPIPVPVYFGKPGDGYPWPFVGYRKLSGRTACQANLSDLQRTVIAEPLAQFLAAIHAIPVEDAIQIGVEPDKIRRMVMSHRKPQVRERLDRLVALGLTDTVDRWDWIFDFIDELPGPLALVHGDLYVRHLLVDPHHRLSGIIDWGDIHLGPPAIDLSIAFSFLPPSAHTAFRNAYGPIDDLAWQHARFRTLHYASELLIYALAKNDADLRREGLLMLSYLEAGRTQPLIHTQFTA